MRLWVLFCSSLILAVGIACSGVSRGDKISPNVQEEAGNIPGLAGVEWPLSFKVARVLEYDQREGRPEPESSIEDRLKASTLEFSEDGAFVYNTTRGVSTLYPVRGKYRVEGNGVVFSGSKTHSYGRAGDSSVNVEGEVNLNASDGPVASVLVREKTIASTSDYGGLRSTKNTSVFSGNLLLEPIN